MSYYGVRCYILEVYLSFSLIPYLHIYLLQYTDPARWDSLQEHWYSLFFVSYGLGRPLSLQEL